VREKVLKEKKHIEELLNTLPLETRPSVSQISEFIKQTQILNKALIVNVMIDKIEKQASKGSSIKCLFIIEELIKNKIEGFEDLFKSKLPVFRALKQTLNYKAVEIIDKIISMLEEENCFKGLEIRNKKNLNDSTSNKLPKISQNDTNNLLIFSDEIKNNDNDKILMNVLSNDNINVTEEPPKKGFWFIKGNPAETSKKRNK